MVAFKAMNGPELATSLEPYSTCDVSDALLQLGYRNGGFISGPTMWSPARQAGDTKIIGPAYTVQYVPLDDEVSPKAAYHYIDSIPTGAVVFISAPKGIVNAVYGGLMSTRAKASGARGTVVDGRIRDLGEHRSLDYPVFANDVGTASPYEVARLSEINKPVRVQNSGQDMLVRPGDYIVADLNGVVCLPAEVAEHAVDVMKRIREQDEKVARDIAGGKTFVEASKSHRQRNKT